MIIIGFCDLLGLVNFREDILAHENEHSFVFKTLANFNWNTLSWIGLPSTATFLPINHDARPVTNSYILKSCKEGHTKIF